MALQSNNQQAMFLGPTGSVSTFNETTLPYPGLLGMKFRQNDKLYQLVKVSTGATAPAPAANTLCFWADKSNYLVGDLGDSEAGVNGVAGLYLGSVTAGRYGFIQIAGEATVLATDTVVAGAEVIAASGVATGIADLILLTATTTRQLTVKRIGYALASGGSGKCTFQMQGLDDE